MKKLLFGIVALLLMAGCTDTATPGDIKLVIQNDEPVIIKGSDKFTGELWTSDRRICDEVKDGKIVKCTFFYKNGSVAAVSRQPDGTDMEFFDENGKPMGEESFNEKYMPDFMKSLQEFNSIQIER